MSQISSEFINEIASNLEIDFHCFYHKKWKEVSYTVHKDLILHPTNDLGMKMILDQIKNEKDNYIHFEPLSMNELKNIMLDFVENEISNKVVKANLLDTLNKEVFVGSFLEVLSRTEYFEDWKVFKEEKTKIYIKTIFEKFL